MEEVFKEVRHRGKEASCSYHAQIFFPTEQHFCLFKAGFVFLFTVNTCHIATEILLNNNTDNVKLPGLEAFNEKDHTFLIKNNK